MCASSTTSKCLLKLTTNCGHCIGKKILMMIEREDYILKKYKLRTAGIIKEHGVEITKDEE